MLKIRDDVDLKELEKFGFKYDNFGYYEITIELKYGSQRLIIDEDSRKIGIVGAGEEALCNLFDLIQAGIVEKVEEEE